MARLKITIEGEMSPEEVKRYIMTAWANLPHDVAVSEVDLREPAIAVEVPPAPEPVGEAPVAAPIPEAQEAVPPSGNSLVEALASHKKLSQVLASMVESGLATDLPSVVALCRNLQAEVPILERLGAALEDRVTRTWAGMQ